MPSATNNTHKAELLDIPPPEMEPANMNGGQTPHVSAWRGVNPPTSHLPRKRAWLEETPALPQNTPHEQLRFHHQYAMLEQAGTQAVILTQAAVFRAAAFITACATSSMWRTSSLALVQAVSAGIAALSQAGAVVAENLAVLPWGEIFRFGKKSLKLGVCLFLDFLDFTIGRLMGFGIIFDLGCALIAAALWGKRGWWCLLEVLDITEQIDGFVPSCTLVALRSWNDE